MLGAVDYDITEWLVNDENIDLDKYDEEASYSQLPLVESKGGDIVA